MNQINQKFMQSMGFTSLTSVQEHVLEALRHPKRDLIVQAATGTGKTHAFLFSLLEVIDPDLAQTQAVIIAPTRELAMQIHQFAETIVTIDERYRIELAIGGMDSQRLTKRIERQPHILIATPGKLLDIFGSATLRLDTVRVCILDEMDMILDYGFIQDINKIASQLLDTTRFMLFSATMPEGLKPFVRKYLHNPLEIRIDNEKKLQPRIEHILINQKHRDGHEAVLDVLTSISPLLAVVFTNTKTQAESLAHYLREYGMECVEIHGNLDSRKRKQVVQQIQSGKVRYIIATDLAARGIDLPEISHVINLNLPGHDLSFYTHRAGRTGRSGREGYAISIVNDHDKAALNRLIKQGFKFTFKRTQSGTLEEVRSFLVPRPKMQQHDAEIAQVLNRKNQRVKPGYKKRRKQEVERIMARRRRDKIRDEIRLQKKERAIANSRKS